MSLQASFGFTNNTVNSKITTLKPADLKPVTDYAQTSHSSTKAELQNTTTPIDQPEVLTFNGSTIEKVDSVISNQYPSSVKDGVTYGVRLDELLSVTSDTDPLYRMDLPIVCQINFRHAKNGQITPEIVQQVLNRTVGALYESNGTSRLNSLMRQAIDPDVD